MTTRKNYWTIKRSDGKWVVKREGSNRASSIHVKQESAWKEARRLARGSGSEAFLKGRDGKIRAQNSYGSDPCSPKG